MYATPTTASLTDSITVVPDTIVCLTAITSLELKCCYLTSIRAEIGNLTSLTSLRLTNCEHITSLPAEIGNLTALKTLSLINCQSLTSLPPEIGKLTALTELDLCGCPHIAPLPREIGNLTALTNLRLDHCHSLVAPLDLIDCQSLNGGSAYSN